MLEAEESMPKYVLTTGEAKVLLALDAEGDASPSELAAAAMLTPSRVASVARRLRDRGFVLGGAGPTDPLHLSSEGEIASRTVKVRIDGAATGPGPDTLIVPDEGAGEADLDQLGAEVNAVLQRLRHS